jgi:hypothetical protein
MKDEDYIDDGGDGGSSNDSDSGSDNEGSDEQVYDDAYYSDSILNQGKMIIILNPQPLQSETHAESSHKSVEHRPKKSKLDREREEILQRLKSLDYKNNLSLKDRIIFSSLPDEHKHYLLKQYEEKSASSSNSDRIKHADYVEKVLMIPFGKYKSINPSFERVPQFILNLRQNLDDAIYGHGETKEEIIDYITSKLRNPESNPSILALKSAPGLGKCHKRDTPILMYDGSVKLVQDIQVGDVIMGDDSTPRNVLTLGTGVDKMFKITHCVSNRSYVVNQEHILCLQNIFTNEHLEIPVKDFVNLSRDDQIKWKGMCAKINFPFKPIDVNPFDAGEYYAQTRGIIPVYCVYNDFNTRLLFLQGIVETIGSYHATQVCIYLHNDYSETIETLLFLIYSLGFIASVDQKTNGIVIVSIFGNANVYIKYPDLFNAATQGIRTEGIKIEEDGEDQYYGFTIDGNNRYVMANCIITHNTKFVRALGKALDLPFQQISFGGLNDPSVLTGHDYTYIGSKPGRIYDCIVKSKYMNSIVYLDELDKLGSPDSDKTIQINGILTHMLDREQNSEFYDHYIGGHIPIDLSKILFIVSFNNEYNVDPIVLNRLKVIEIKENTIADKISIVRKFTIPETLKNLNLQSEKFSISDDVIKYIILHRTVFEKGMRNINKNFYTLFGKLNTLLYLENAPKSIKTRVVKNLTYEKISLSRTDDGQIIVSKDLVDKLLAKKQEYQPYMSMYN